jgi:hypothetical protein
MRALCCVLAAVVPLQAASLLMLQARGPAHSHSSKTRTDLSAESPSAKLPEGFEWAAAAAGLRRVPTHQEVIAALRMQGHGSRSWDSAQSAKTAPASRARTTHAAPPSTSDAESDDAGDRGHAHESLQRHHHANADASVVALGNDPVLDERDAPTAQAVVMAWAPPADGSFHALDGAGADRRPGAFHRWHSHIADRRDRPPKAS